MSESQDLDPRTARDDEEDATTQGVSATEPVEGADANADEGSTHG